MTEKGTELATAPPEPAAIQKIVQSIDAEIVEQVVIGGDMAQLDPHQRVSLYKAVCDSLGLNPLTWPFSYIEVQGKMRLYARREATDQLRQLHGINVEITDRRKEDDLYIVMAKATNGDGRSDESMGAVAISGLKGENLANAYMKTETKAKRRATLALVGLGWLDETEVGNIPGAVEIGVDRETGEMLPDNQQAKTKSVAARNPKDKPTEGQLVKYRELVRNNGLTKRWEDRPEPQTVSDLDATIKKLTTAASTTQLQKYANLSIQKGHPGDWIPTTIAQWEYAMDIVKAMPDPEQKPEVVKAEVVEMPTGEQEPPAEAEAAAQEMFGKEDFPAGQFGDETQHHH